MRINYKKNAVWLKSQDVCKLLNISLSTLTYNLLVHKGDNIPMPDNELYRTGTDARKWEKTKFEQWKIDVWDKRTDK